VNYKLGYSKKCKKTCEFRKKNCEVKAKIGYHRVMSKEKAIQLAGSVKALAELLGISRPAIYQWGVNVPKWRVYQLKELRPQWF
jgi:hypothetical protein